MLKTMVQSLSNADLNAIRKARGLPGKETDSRPVFETYFLSSVGVAKVLASLSEEEIALLHLMARLKSEVEIGFFARIYGDESQGQKYYYGTPTKRYRETFAQVQKNLVRRGALVVAEDSGSGEASKIDRWRFRFPSEFEQFLPPLIASPYRSAAPGEFRSHVLRDKLLEILTGIYPSPLRDRTKYRLQIADGGLLIGEVPFRIGRLLEWQQECWEAEAKLQISQQSPRTLSPLEAVISVFSQLEEGEWIRPEQLSIPLKVFCDSLKVPNAGEICAAGWKWGCLARLKEDHALFYRMPADRLRPDVALGNPPQDYLQVDEKRPDIGIDLHRIPFDALERLGRAADLRVTGGKLLASPNRIKIGRLESADLQHSPIRWLREHSPAFEEAIRTMEQRWGRQIVHAGLVIARVRDLSLKVQIERALNGQGQLISLSGEYLAFPPGLQPEVERLVKKAGYVVKTVQAK